jgi:hypothetical protein
MSKLLKSCDERWLGFIVLERQRIRSSRYMTFLTGQQIIDLSKSFCP